MPVEKTTSPRLDDSRFLFAFAHDLRSHLRTVLTRIQLVQAGAGANLPESERNFLQEAAGAASDINGLVSAMVAYCDVSVKNEPMPLRTLLRGLLLENQRALQAVEAELILINELDVSVPRAMQSVLKELLSNSIRFRRSLERLRVEITTRVADAPSQPATVEILVSDNGHGVEAPDLERIFAPFQRLRSRTEYPGHGMGLAIARRVVSAYGGTILAEPATSGGLAVRLTLPLTRQAD